MEDSDIFGKNLDKLKLLIETKANEQLYESLNETFCHIEENWKINVTRFPNEKLIKYLLICEAPLSSDKYFYSNTQNGLIKKVWKTFFDNGFNQNCVYDCLASMGFLLVDSLPYAISYSGFRKNQVYDKLISACLNWWINKLNNNFTFACDLRIAFGFKLNALSIIKATSNPKSKLSSICLGDKNYSINDSQIVADISHRWQPSTNNLKKIFGLPQLSNNSCP